MKALEDKLEKLDLYFAPKKQSEKVLMIGLVAFLIGLFGY